MYILVALLGLCSGLTNDPPPYVTRKMVDAQASTQTLLLAWATEPSVAADQAPSGLQESAEPEAGARPSEQPTKVPVTDALAQDALVAARLAPWIAAHVQGGEDLRYTRARDIAWAIARWSRNYRIRPELVAALISVESSFSPGAKSRTNDHGLMQLHGRRIYDIEANVQAGCAHLAGNLASAGGDEYKALCFYNGGPKGTGYGQCQRYASKVLGIAAQVPVANVEMAMN